jgi:hypothetical protein
MNNPDNNAAEHELARERENERAPGPVPEIVSPTDDEPSKGPNLVLLYSILALALAVAIGLAVSIVLPFYHRR